MRAEKERDLKTVRYNHNNHNPRARHDKEVKKETAEERKVRDTIQIQPQYSHRNCCDAYLLKYEVCNYDCC